MPPPNRSPPEASSGYSLPSASSKVEQPSWAGDVGVRRCVAREHRWPLPLDIEPYRRRDSRRARRRVLDGDLSAAYGPEWRQRLDDFDETPAATASIGQVHRGRWRDDRGDIIDVAVKVQYPGVAKALHSDLRGARVFGRLLARATGLDVAGLTEELAARFADELDYVREGRVQNETAAAFAQPVPEALVLAHEAGAHEPPGRTSVVVPHVYAAMPGVLVSTWLDGAPSSALLNHGGTPLPSGWREGRNLPLEPTPGAGGAVLDLEIYPISFARRALGAPALMRDIAASLSPRHQPSASIHQVAPASA